MTRKRHIKNSLPPTQSGMIPQIVYVYAFFLSLNVWNGSNAKTTIPIATPRAIPRIDGNPHEGFSFAAKFVEIFENFPVLPFLDFFVFLICLLPQEFLCSLPVFPFLFQGLGGRKIVVFWGGIFPCFR